MKIKENTLVLSLSEYNDLRDFKKAIEREDCIVQFHKYDRREGEAFKTIYLSKDSALKDILLEQESVLNSYKTSSEYWKKKYNELFKDGIKKPKKWYQFK